MEIQCVSWPLSVNARINILVDFSPDRDGGHSADSMSNAFAP